MFLGSAVFLGYASRHGRALLDRALYLPQGWTKDEARRRAARIPDEVAFATKPKLGLAMLERARVAGVPFSGVTGDSVYGGDYAIRSWARQHRRGYVLGVTSGQHLGLRPVTVWIEELDQQAWARLSAGEGAKGERMYDWACLPHAGAAEGFCCALLVRRSIGDPEAALTFYLTHAPEGTSLTELVRVAGSRWSIESLFEQAKGEVGLDQYEVRSWVGWHRHVTLAMVALAYLAGVRRGAAGGWGAGEPGRRPAAAHRARGAAPALGARGRYAAQTRRRAGLVALAPTPPATRTSLTLAPANTGPSA